MRTLLAVVCFHPAHIALAIAVGKCCTTKAKGYSQYQHDDDGNDRIDNH